MKNTLYAIRLIFLCFGLAISSWAPLIPYVKDALSLDDAQLGSVFLLSGLGSLLSMPIAGWIMGKFGSRPIIFISGLATLACLPLLAIASTTLILSFTLFFFGIAAGTLNVSMNAQAVDVETASHLPILSGIHCWFSIGGLLGPIMISILLNFEISLFYCIFSVSTLILFILVTQVQHLLSSTPQKNMKEEASKGSYLNRQVIFLGALCFIAFMAEGSMVDWSAEYLHSNLNYDYSIAGIGYSAFSISMAIGRFFGNRLIKRFGNQLIFQLGCLFAAGGFATVITASWTNCELFGFMLIGLGASNIVPILFSSCGKLSNTSSSAALTVVTACGCMGLLTGPALIGFLAEATNLSLSFLVVAMLLTGIGICGRPAIYPSRVNT